MCLLLSGTGPENVSKTHHLRRPDRTPGPVAGRYTSASVKSDRRFYLFSSYRFVAASSAATSLLKSSSYRNGSSRHRHAQKSSLQAT
jgi:hypothetical protein